MLHRNFLIELRTMKDPISTISRLQCSRPCARAFISFAFAMSAVRWFSADNPTHRILPSKKRKTTQERFSTQTQSPNRLSRFAAVLKQRKIGPYIKVYEDDDIFHAVHDYIVGGTSEVNAALRKSRNTVLKSRRHQFILKRLWVNLLMRRNKEAERKRRSATPAALRQLSISFPEKLDSTGSIPTLQLVPSRRHASSGFPYPDWLADYGISRED